jgi:predicted nucleic acid-binding protein
VVHYIDTSALVKLVVREPESEALEAWVAGHRDLICSELVRTELPRAVRRAAPERLPLARTVIESITVLALRAAEFDEAGRLGPSSLRTLDAIHLASALTLGEQLESFVCYDPRLSDAARGLGLPVTAPA